MGVLLTDTILIDSPRRTGDGYLVADARVARSGIQEYTGREVDPSNEFGFRDRASVRVYRPDAEVFADAALKSYAYRPITVNHPPVAVTADNWREYAIGQTGGEVLRDGEFVRVPMVLMDAQAIKAVEAGQRELSMGYSTTLKFEDGKSPDGEQYDAIQTDLRMNHLAVVAVARGGSNLRIGDTTEEPRSMTTRTITVDGLSVELADKDAQIVERHLKALDTRAADAAKALADANDAHAKALAAKDAEIDSLKAKVLDEAALDKRVMDRGDVIAKAKALAPDVKTAGVSDHEIRKAVVVAKHGPERIADKSAAYIDAAFDLLADDAEKSGTFTAALASAPVQTGDAYDKAYDKSVTDLNAWRNK